MKSKSKSVEKNVEVNADSTENVIENTIEIPDENPDAIIPIAEVNAVGKLDEHGHLVQPTKAPEWY